MPHTLSDLEFDRFRELNNGLQMLMSQALIQDPTSSEADGIAQAKREVGHGVDKFLTLVGR